MDRSCAVITRFCAALVVALLLPGGPLIVLWALYRRRSQPLHVVEQGNRAGAATSK